MSQRCCDKSWFSFVQVFTDINPEGSTDQEPQTVIVIQTVTVIQTVWGFKLL
ncbi:hypothetical protein M486_3083 [Yersinia pestis 1045]|uniref:Uncharacterized protein n=4 Tax=Yersinia pseudotuberculosis complex TaxID=1649845 RepID=A0AAX2I9K4_YERPE|nr:hypothetical protein BZ21_1037 [Yersinia pseudotuberculosis]AJJ15739.1 hypothetical protein CH46_3312 [Yersinia pestis]AJJ61256.1 hypothetical protein BZ22_2960 [Yersinia pseudotuberculosis YPIII]AJJ67058.1 hypothetical protein BZ16_1113 [Yersinia pseudotuberculosis PB1/+]AJJ74275.1 hypothetical protein CH57_4071 [Yersinia pestis A1122]AKS83855.1 hypothetical protein M477_2445 [Yersinia pestis 790]AKS96071.1 hypothetical protein M482_2879 [Yersinia pestis 3067]AKT01063.1 hypothetical prot